MREIAKRAETVIVLDHHQSAEQALLPLLEEGIIEGEFDMERSGAGMTWDFFRLDEPRPKFIDYVEDRDLWRFALPNSKEVTMAIFSYEYTFDNWDQFRYCFDSLEDDGKAILRKHMKDVHELTEQTMYLTIGGYKNIPTVNANYFYGSDLAAVLGKDQPFGAYFWMNADQEYCFGLRSAKDGADVAKVAQAYGGGGHKHASGFRIKSLEDLNINAIVNENGSLSFP
jgi:oligoribonuclease NrnB/cAMP/cGMP phosphodiesterase (DHH superfamily)